MEKISSDKDLVVWQLSRVLVKDTYALTMGFPKSEMYGLTNQIRRACVSIPSNIAEGHARRGRNDYAQFVAIALGSLAELETQLILSEDLGFCCARELLTKTEDLKIKMSALYNALTVQRQDMAQTG
jgi:four helix bundle protein